MTSKILDYVAQPNGYTCQSASIARILGTTDVMAIRAQLEAIGEPGDPATMGAFLKSRVQEYKFLDNGSLNDARIALKSGYQIITHGWFTDEGHVIGLSGVEPDTQGYQFTAEDPWAEFDFPSNAYTSNPGQDVRYSSYGIYAYCVAANSREDAAAVYARRELDSARPGAWLHLIKN